MRKLADKVTHFIHHHFLAILFGAYALAVFYPMPGSMIREISLGQISLPDQSQLSLSVPLLMLAILLFNAGLCVKSSEFQNLLRHPALLVSGLVLNTLVPLSFALICACLSGLWHSEVEAQNLLIGLALIISMPIAGSSSAWSQNANGNLSLSLGFVVFSTLLSPLITPLGLEAISFLTDGQYALALRKLAEHGTSGFLAIGVVLPSILGVACHFLFGEKRISSMKSFIKLITQIDLLILIYSNAAIALPQAFKPFEWEFFLLIMIITTSLCLITFFIGWLVPQILKSSKADQASMMFALGMNNNGTGLVLASMQLAQFPLVMLPIVIYNLIQQIIAGLVDRHFFSENDQDHPESYFMGLDGSLQEKFPETSGKKDPLERSKELSRP
ncbi:MAG: bile acid:sodium symporter [Candidatus Caenarcaniphilales bacterium]|nr:bile acid:sodium symporter [Candidatus Caenarcaniphilales bacterium]